MKNAQRVKPGARYWNPAQDGYLWFTGRRDWTTGEYIFRDIYDSVWLISDDALAQMAKA